MNHKWLFFLILLSILAGLPLISDVHSSASPEYRIDWWTIDGGGAISSTGGDFSLSGTIGQPENGTSSAGNFAVSGGFWGVGEGTPTVYKIILVLLFR
jgi:hypothetical protein